MNGDSASPRLSLRLFGVPSLERDGTPLGGPVAQRRRIALLALLALAPDGTASRDRLIALLWPEAETDKARHNLAVAVHALRAALGDDVLPGSGDDLRLALDRIRCDVTEFSQAIARGDVEQAIGQFTAPFLDGFHLGDSSEFDVWADGHRQRLSDAYRDALERAANLRLEKRDASGAVELWRRRAAIDPLSARGAMGLMRALDAAGDRAGALQHARVHAALLKSELDAEPDQEVEAFAERLRASRERQAEAPRIERADDTEQAATPAQPSTRRRFAPLGAAIAVVAIVAVLSIVVRTRGRTATPSSETDIIRSLAVMPFANASPDSADAYFADGMTDEMIATLARVDGLRVPSRSSVFALRGANRDARDIGKQLGVDAVLEGSVRRSGDRVRIIVELVNAKTGYHVWSDSYDRRVSEVFAVQDSITSAVVSTLRPWLGERRGVPMRIPTRDVAAYDDYLKATYVLRRDDEAAAHEALGLLDRAIARDSSFARAFAAKTQAYIKLAEFRPARDVLPAARAAALRALALDSGDVDTRTALGDVRMIYEHDWKAAEREYKRAVAIDSSSQPALAAYSRFLRASRRLDEAIHLDRVALALRRPELSDSAFRYASLSIDMRDAYESLHFARADSILRIQEAMRPGAMAPHWMRGMILTLLGRAPEGVPELERVRDMTHGALPQLSHLGYAYARAGRTADARGILEELQRRAKSSYVPKDQFASIYLGLGDTTAALDWLERAVDDNHWWNYQIVETPLWRPLYGNERFLKLIDRIGAPRP
jgi:serine/threonine-protein kinase